MNYFQEQNYETVLSVLKAFRTNEIDGAVGVLSDTDVDVLMKYLYKGFSSSPGKAASLLLWHEKVSLLLIEHCSVRAILRQHLQQSLYEH